MGFRDHQGTLSGVFNERKYNISSPPQDINIKTGIAQVYFNFKMSRFILQVLTPQAICFFISFFLGNTSPEG